MTDKQKNLLLAIVGFAVVITGAYCKINQPEVSKQESLTISPGAIPVTQEMWEREILENPEEFLYERLLMEGIKEPDIVYAQAMLETGNFTSRLCVEDHNLFGLYDSVHQCYYQYSDWRECVRDYKKLVEKKYKGGDYYHFLESLPYSTAPDYTKRIKVLVKQIQQI